jgi:hypothetical protein
MKVFIQIGSPRTGTTYLQNYYYERSSDICYLPHVRIWNRWLSPLMHSQSSVVVICEETLTCRASQEEMGKIGWRLAEVFKEPEIILVTREVSSKLIFSFYSQMVKCGSVLSFREYLNTMEGRRLSHTFNYCKISEIYQSIFGVEKVHVLSYEKLVSDPRRFFEELSSLLGVPTFIPDERPLNSSFSGAEVKVLRKTNKILLRILRFFPTFGVPHSTICLYVNELKITKRCISLLSKTVFRKSDDTLVGIESFVRDLKSKIRSTTNEISILE